MVLADFVRGLFSTNSIKLKVGNHLKSRRHQRLQLQRAVVESLEQRLFLSASDITTTLWQNSDAYTDYIKPIFVAEGRAGNFGYSGTHEIDVSKTTGGPFASGETQQFVWTALSDIPFLVKYDPSVGGGDGTVTFKVGGLFSESGLDIIGGTTATHLPKWTMPEGFDTIFLRTYAGKLGTEVALRDMKISTNGGELVSVPKPDGSTSTEPVETKSTWGTSADRDGLQIEGVDLRHGFVLTGYSKWTFNPSSKPTNSNLAFQIKVGSWRPPVLPAINDSATPGGLAGGGGAAFGADGGDPNSLGMNAGSVRYFNGELVYGETDIATSTEGNGWGQSRFYASQLGYKYDQTNGNNWVNAQQPFMVQVKGESGQVKRMAVISNPNNIRWFERQTDGTWKSPFFLNETLTAGNGEFVFADTLGNVTRFFDFQNGTSLTKRGKLKGFTDAGGHSVTVEYGEKWGTRSDTNGENGGNPIDLFEIRKVTRGVEKWEYDYQQGSDGQMLLMSVKVMRGETGAELELRSVTYTYYGNSEQNGRSNDLKTVVVKEWDSQANALVETSKSRYFYKVDSVTKSSKLWRMITGVNYQRAVKAGLNPEEASQEALAPFFDHSFIYDELHRVTQDVAQGVGGSTVTQPNAAGYLHYTGYARNQRSLAPLQHNFNRWQYKNVESGPNGSTVTVYSNDAGAPILRIVQAGSVIFRTFYKYDDKGRLEWVAMPSAVTGFDETKDDLLDNTGSNYTYLQDTEGLIYFNTYNSDGYLEYSGVKRGELGTAINVTKAEYFTKTVGDFTVRPVNASTEYHEESNSGAQRTTITYDSWTNLQPTSTTTTRPDISSQNGPASATEISKSFDEYGRLTDVSTGIESAVSYAYDSATGSLKSTSVYAEGLNEAPLLTIVLQFDRLGRATQIQDPEGNITNIAYSNSLTEMKTTTTPAAGPRLQVILDKSNGYTDSEKIARASEAVLSRTRSYFDYAGRTTAEDRYFLIPEGTTRASNFVGSQDTNFYRTELRYDSAGRNNWIKNAVGTVTLTEFDAFDRPTWVKVGITDMPSDAVASFAYSHPDGLQTGMTSIPGGSASNRTTNTYYDWRDRVVATKNATAVAYSIMDNLDRITSSRIYDAAGATLADTDSDGVPDAPDATKLRARQDVLYDDLNQVYEGRMFEVNPSNGTVGSFLATKTWHDGRGNAIKVLQPGGLVTQTRFDGANRADRVSIGSETIELQIVEIQLDGNGNPLLTTRKERNADGSGYRTSYTANYYDVAGRLTDTVEAGTNSGSAYTRPSNAEARSDSRLVMSYVYDAAGMLELITDPKNIATKKLYDAAGRVNTQLENYIQSGTDPLVYTTDQNRETKYTYTGLDQIKSVTAKNVKPDGTSQQLVTTNYFGPSSGEPGTNDTLRLTTYPGFETDPVGSSEQYKFNLLNEITFKKDRSNVKHTYSYNDAGNLIGDLATEFPSSNGNFLIDNSIEKLSFAYDVLGRILVANSEGHNSAGAWVVKNRVEHAYDGFGNLLTDHQDHDGDGSDAGKDVIYHYDTSNNRNRLDSLTYPNGRQISFSYNSGLDSDISRVSAVKEGTTIYESYSYLGLGRVIGRSQATGLTLTIGLDDFGRVSETNWASGAGTTADHFEYGYDRNSNLLWREDKVHSQLSELYHANGAGNGYDPLNRIVAFNRGTLNTSKDSIATALGNSQATYSWDAQSNLQNSSKPTYDAGNTSQYTNPAGNSLTAVYDAWGRLVKTSASGPQYTEYTYDALGRQITSKEHAESLQVLLGQTLEVKRDLYHDAAGRVLEEFDVSAEAPVQQYVWSAAGGTLAMRFRNSIAGAGLNEKFYVMQDARNNVTSIAAVTGSVQERYIYDPFGSPQAIKPDGTPWGFNNPFSSASDDVKMGQFFVGPYRSYFSADDAYGGTQYAWNYYAGGQRFATLSGVYVASGGQGYNPRDAAMMQTDYGNLLKGRNAHDASAGGSWFERHSLAIASGSAIGLGIAVSVLTLGAASPLVAGAGLFTTTATGTTLTLAGTVAAEAIAGAAGMMTTGAAIRYANGASASEIGNGLVWDAGAGAITGGLFGAARYALVGGITVRPFLAITPAERLFFASIPSAVSRSLQQGRGVSPGLLRILLRRTIFDNRNWKTISAEWWRLRGGAGTGIEGLTRDHYLIRQATLEKLISAGAPNWLRGINNSPMFSGLVMTRGMNSWLGNVWWARWGQRGIIVVSAGSGWMAGREIRSGLIDAN